jgi:hypothetical protein
MPCLHFSRPWIGAPKTGARFDLYGFVADLTGVANIRCVVGYTLGNGNLVTGVGAVTLVAAVGLTHATSLSVRKISVAACTTSRS